ncbi:MAG: Hsp33 family molecular chaperone HslO [Myxococcota bacterium]|nr:Hsp33 family molecular chaperone HslO [Myxococcota bacterium]
MSGTLYRILLPDPGLRLFIAEARDVVAEAADRHQLTAGSVVPLGRAMLAASLIAWDTKSGHRITLQFKSQGPIGAVVADAHPDGSVRGYVNVPQIQFPVEDVQRLAHAALGNRGGSQLVRETQDGMSTGQVELVTGGIDRDVEALISASDGERGALGLGVFVSGKSADSLQIDSATGAMLLALPDADPYAFDELARRVRQLSGTPWKGSVSELADELCGDHRYEVLLMQDLCFNCMCSEERVTKVLISLGPGELRAMAEETGYGEIICHFCNHAYRFEKQALLLMADGLEPIEAKSIGQA